MLKSAGKADSPVEKVVGSGVAIVANEQGRVVRKSALTAVAVGTVPAARVGRLASFTDGVALKEPKNADTVASGGVELIKEVRGAVCAVGAVGAVALIAFAVVAGHAGARGGIFIEEPSALRLAESGGEVEVGVGVHAAPGLHVEDGGLAPAEPADVVDVPGLLEFNSEGAGSVDSFIDEVPLVDEPATAPLALEGGDGHDEVVLELYGYIQEPSVEIVVPFLEDYEIFLRGLHVVGVEYDFAEVEVGH